MSSLEHFVCLSKEGNAGQGNWLQLFMVASISDVSQPIRDVTSFKQSYLSNQLIMWMKGNRD